MVEPHEMERIIEQAAERALKSERINHVVADAVAPIIQKSLTDTLISLGLDTSRPIDLQRDLAYLRTLRLSGDEIRSNGLNTATTVVITGTIALIILGIKDWLLGP